MRPVIYSMSVSVDGFTAAPDGSIDWAAPDDEIFAVHDERVRDAAVQFCGRRLYEVMQVWETDPPRADSDFGRIWAALPKVVFSSTLTSVSGNATLATGDVADELARARDGADGHVAVGGPGLAAEFIRRDLVDEYQMFVHPVILGGGTPYFPARPDRLDLELVENRTFGSGVVLQRFHRAR